MHCLFINSNKRSEISPVDDDTVQIIGKKIASDYQISPIDRDMFVTHSGW